MKKASYVDTKLGKLSVGIFLFVLLYFSRNSMVTMSWLGFYPSQFAMLGTLALGGLCFLYAHRAELPDLLKNRRMGILLFWALALLLPMLWKRDFQMMYFTMLICVVAGILLSYLLPLEELAKYFVLLLSMLALYSFLATYLLRPLAGAGLLPAKMVYNSRGIAYYNFFFAFPSVEYVRFRNLGIFREAGVFHCFLMLGLYLNFYRISWKKEKNLWIIGGILAVAMLTTMSTAGYVELAIFALVIYVERKLYRKKILNLLLSLLAALLLVGFLYVKAQENMLYWELYGMFVSKFQPGEESSADRIGSILLNLQFFFAHPLAGATASDVLYGILNNTSSSTLLFAICGGFAGVANLLSWGVLVLDGREMLLGKCLVLLTVLMAVNTQNLITDVFFWLFPIAAMAQGGDRKERSQNGFGND